MKRFLVLAVALVLVSSVAAIVSADPINVGGLELAMAPINVGGLELAAAPINVGGLELAASPINVGGLEVAAARLKLPSHAKAHGLRRRLVVEPVLLFASSPINVGGLE